LGVAQVSLADCGDGPFRFVEFDLIASLIYGRLATIQAATVRNNSPGDSPRDNDPGDNSP
jgi:hypothetical protein